MPTLQSCKVPKPCPFILAIGASAGGLEALTQLLESTVGLTGMALVVVQHLSPDFKSMMPELLSRHTDMEVTLATDGAEPRADTIYMIEPDTLLTFHDGRLRVGPSGRQTGKLFLPINELFTSLAAERGSECAVVVLSGTGNDGASGLRSAKGHGAVTIAQQPDSARFDGMPRAALATGAVDLVLTPDHVLPQLLQMRQEGQAQYFSAGAGHGELVISRILSALRTHTKLDFSFYKPATVIRRVERRMRQLDMVDARDYADRVFLDVEESKVLQRELLIGVTRFLRDEGAIDAVRSIAIPRLLERAEHEPLRLWVAGCSSGEEAYSLAMLLQQGLDELPSHRGFKLFATDVDGEAIEQASAGEFSEEGVAFLPPELRERNFTRRGGRYVVSKSLREKLLFSRHDLIQDPPFSRIDMVSCRNLLIYLKPMVQDRVLGTFAGALRDRGVLWLGTSETIGEGSQHFDTLDARWRLYEARPGRKRAMPSLIPGRGASEPDAARKSKTDPLRPVLEALLESHVPPCEVIDAGLRVLYRFGNLGGLLRLPSGAVSLDVRDLLPESVGVLISSLVSRAREATDTVCRELSASTERGVERFDLRVRRLVVADHGELFALFFEQLKPERAEDQSLSPQQVDAETRDRMELLERELRQSRESLQATIEELESSNEELQATNEELIAANEELQSTNEELQSVNEELHTVNSEFSEKLNEVSLLNDDLDRLFGSVDVGIVLLDQDFAIRRFNKMAAVYFNVLAQDVGRPLVHLSHRLLYPQLLDDCMMALRNEGAPIWRRVPTRDGMQHAQVQIRGQQGEMPGGRSVVITLTDITAVEGTQRELGRLIAAFEQSGASIAVVDADDRILHVNPVYERSVGRSAASLKHVPLLEVTPATERERLREGLLRCRAGARWAGVFRTRTGANTELFEVVRLVPTTQGDRTVVRIADQLTDDFVSYERERGEREPAALGPLYYCLWTQAAGARVIDERVLEVLNLDSLAAFDPAQPERFAVDEDVAPLKELLRGPGARAQQGYRFRVRGVEPERIVQLRARQLAAPARRHQLLLELVELTHAARGKREGALELGPPNDVLPE